MYIHVVRAGENIYYIAKLYGVTPEKIIRDNEVSDPNHLVIGQTLVILMNEINEYEKRRSLAVNGYAYEFINLEVLKKTLYYLTTLTIFGYGFTEDGALIPIEDEKVIQTSLEGGVAPIMLLAGKKEDGSFSSERISLLLNDPFMQDRLLEEVLINIEQKKYYGLDLDFEYIYPEDKDVYVEFTRKATEKLNEKGYTVHVDLAPKTYKKQPGLLYEAKDYEKLGNAANTVLLMTYEWGYKYGH